MVNKYDRDKHPSYYFEDLDRIRASKKKKDIDDLTSVLDFTDEQIEKFRALNNFLTKFEFNLKSEIQAIFKTRDKFNVSDDYVFDEITINLSFYLSQNDEYYDEDYDNCIIVLTESFNIDRDLEREDYWGLADGNCHNTLLNRQGHVMQDDKHCWIMHALYDHTELSYDEILKISYIDISYKIQHNKKSMIKIQFIE